jgi:tRNA pseudouridine55 synthase
MKIDVEQGSVLLVDKPLHWTSFDVVNKLRYALLKNLHRFMHDAPDVKRKIKVGHAGTLDPLASGLLIVCIGKETKNIDQYMATEKEYTGTIYIGATTPSYDLETEVYLRYEIGQITNEKIFATAQKFLGVQEQLPPIFSAIKQDGKRLYQSAREGKEVELKPREIAIMEFDITGIEMPLIHFRVVCSKGTYIRSLAHDFGKALGVGAYLHALRRTRSGKFHVNDALTVEQWVQRIHGQE